ncbi:MAG TPA: hypothetical protein VFE31_13490 [Opitutaceae bacterium]|jgi:hypothetical protein|nr:hypothetical protein [Opitutaceae bacterium]
MHRRIHVVALLILSLLGSGTQWDLLQVFAWGRMIANHSQSMCLSAAVSKTFSGEMCGICRMIAQAKQQERQHSNVPAVTDAAKPVLFCHRPAIYCPQPVRIAAERPDDALALSALPAAPPVPPPRTV